MSNKYPYCGKLTPAEIYAITHAQPHRPNYRRLCVSAVVCVGLFMWTVYGLCAAL